MDNVQLASDVRMVSAQVSLFCLFALVVKECKFSVKYLVTNVCFSNKKAIA